MSCLCADSADDVECVSLPKELNGSPVPLIKMIAPAGKLGVVFENKTGGGCHVKSVKGSSPLAEKVQPGDCVIEVDGETTAALDMDALVNLLTKKKDAAQRELTIERMPVAA